jgi:Icc protein
LLDVKAMMPIAPLHVAQLTDLHLFASPDQQLLNLTTSESFQAVLSAVKQLNPFPDLLLLTGDISQDESPESYKYLQDLLCPLRIPTYWLPGNHDRLPIMQQVLTRTPFSGEKSFTVQGWRFVLLNSALPGQVHGELHLSELEWLEETLQQSTDPTLVAVHHPPLPINSDWMDQILLHNADDLLAVLDRYSQVKVVLFGHIHQEFDYQRNGVRYLGTPSTCIQFLPESAKFALDETRPGFRLLKLYPDGSWHTQVERVIYNHILDLTATGY